MVDSDKILPDKEPFFPEGSVIMLVAHLGVGLFFIIACSVLNNYIETFKMLILGYYTLFSAFFLFFYYRQLRVPRIFLLWCLISLLQLAIYFFNVDSLAWDKWSFSNVLSSLAGLPVVMALYQSFRKMSLKQGKDLVIGIRRSNQPTKWDIAATIAIPLVALMVCLF